MATDLKEFKKALASLSKKYDDKTIIKDVKNANLVKFATFESPLLNYVLGGKYVTGRIMQLFGPESSGKSTVSTYIGGQLQKIKEDQPIVVYLDFERTFVPEFAARLGLNIDEDHFVLIQPDTMEDGFEIAEELIKSGKVCLVIFDSEAAAPTRKQADSEYGQADFGIAALQMTKGLKKLNIQLSKYDTSMIIISQERDNQQMMSHAIVSTGGRALKFYASTRNRVTKIDTIEKNGETAGIKLKIRNYKNKTGIMFREAELTLYFDSGFDSDAEYMDFFIKLGIVKQAGAWFSYFKNKDDAEPTFKCAGRDKLQAWFDEHKDEFIACKNKVNELLSKETEELDSERSAPPEARADSLEESQTASELATLAMESQEDDEKTLD